MSQKTKLLVLGSGFAGVTLLRQLRYQPDLEITLITSSPTFRYGATVWRAATGYRKDGAYIPIEALLGVYPNLTIIYDDVASINRKNQFVTTKSGAKFTYDYCVIGLGMVTSYFGIEGLEQYSYTIKSSDGLDKLRKHFHKEVMKDGVLDKNYVVVGAGPTGVELSAALVGYLKEIARYHKLKRPRINVELVEASPFVLPAMPRRAGKIVRKRLSLLGVRVMTQQQVKKENKNTIIIGKRTLPTKTVIWTAGVSNNPFFFTNPDEFVLNEKKRVIVDGNLRVDKHVFVLGDNAATPYSGLALTAVHNARYAAKVIRRELEGKRVKPYKPVFPLTIIPVGDGWALLQWKKLILSGKFASFLRQALDVVGYAYVMGYPRAWQLWQHRNDLEESCLICQKAIIQKKTP